MRRDVPILCLIALIAALVLPATVAGATGGIRFTAGQKEYYFVVGSPAVIPLAATSSYPQEMPGTIQLSTDEQLQQPGMVMVSTQNRVFPYTVEPGDSYVNLSAGTSDRPTDYKVHLTFDYTDSSPKEVTLPEIIIHFVADPAQAQNSASPVSSSTGAGTGSVPTSSSVHISQQTVSPQQQAGNDGSTQSALQNNQMQQDANALRNQLEQEKAKRDAQQSEFKKKLLADPLVQDVNATLGTDGFSRQALTAQPVTNDTGTYSMTYRNDAGTQIAVSGSMTGGVVPSAFEQSNTTFNTTPALETDAGFRSFDRSLAGQGFVRTDTRDNRTLSDAVINLTYTNPEGRRAFVNATMNGGVLTGLSLATEPETSPLPLVLAVAASIAVAACVAWLVYRRYFRMKKVGGENPVGSGLDRQPFDHRHEAKRILERAGIAFSEQRYTEAYGYAGQALRLFLSYEHGARTEMTNRELLNFLRAQGKEAAGVPELLTLCSDVEFAKGGPDVAGFSEMIGKIREIIDEPRII
jgi:hypothetical protein